MTTSRLGLGCKFDFIHARMLSGPIADENKLFRQAYDNLAPGGWFELMDFCFHIRPDDETMQGTAFESLNNKLMEGLSMVGRDGALADKFKKIMKNTSFDNITESGTSGRRMPGPRTST